MPEPCRKERIFPPEKELFEPDPAFFIANASQASRLVTLDQFWDGCASPSYKWLLVLERNNMSFSNRAHKWYIRRSQREELMKLDDGERMVSIPFERQRTAEAIDLSIAGAAEPFEGWKRKHGNL